MYVNFNIVDEKKNRVEIPDNYDIDDVIYFLNDSPNYITIYDHKFILDYILEDNEIGYIDIKCEKDNELIDITTNQLSKQEYNELLEKIKQELEENNISNVFFTYPKSLRNEYNPFKTYCLLERMVTEDEWEDFELYDKRYEQWEKEFEEECSNCSGIYLILDEEEIFDD